MRKALTILIFAASMPFGAFAKGYARLDGDTLRIGNNRMERVFLWNGGDVKTIAVIDKASGSTLRSAADPGGRKTGVTPPGSAALRGGRLVVDEVPANGVHAAYTAVTIENSVGTVTVRRRYRVYDDCPAIACDTWVRGRLAATDDGKMTSAADRKNIESQADMRTVVRMPVIDELSLSGKHWRCRAVEFADYTDWNDNLVSVTDFYTYRDKAVRGNLLFAQNTVTREGFFFLKESPCSSTQLHYPGYDFRTDFANFRVAGIGLSADDISDSCWTQAYSVVLGVWSGGEREALEALRQYQRKARQLRQDSDDMVMMNTWGDRNQDSRVSENFILGELDKASALGISVYQIDDGWQTGKSPNSKVAKGSFKGIWQNPDYWKPDTVKFPHGLYAVAKKARKLGMRLGLWFNPSIQDDFADWRKDAGAVLGLWRKYGIDIFKIDGVQMPTKRAEENFHSFLDSVQTASQGKITFNLDVTAGKRGGYNMFCEYGNIFLENRYTDWGNYYPYRTLRNLWLLSRYVPAQRLQVEFLNKWRNEDKYSPGDVFAPARYSFDYLFATTMAAQPLAWMEASGLPPTAMSTASLIKDYRKVQRDLHRGTILPIGDEPSGTAWTGFQSITSPGEGYLLIYREDNPQATGFVRTWLGEGRQVSLTPVLGHGGKAIAEVGRDGVIAITLPAANDFVLYKYKEVKSRNNQPAR